MTCFMCKGNVTKNTTSYMTECNGRYIIIKNVPCMKCTQCGDELFNTDILEKIDEIIAMTEKLASEVSIIDHSKVA